MPEDDELFIAEFGKKEDPVGYIFVEIGGKDDLRKSTAKKTAKAFRIMRARYPTAKVGFAVRGYDEDPRELYEIPEVIEFIKYWAIEAGLSDWRDAIQINWEPHTGCLGILQLCGVFADDSPIKVNKPTKH